MDIPRPDLADKVLLIQDFILEDGHTRADGEDFMGIAASRSGDTECSHRLANFLKSLIVMVRVVEFDTVEIEFEDPIPRTVVPESSPPG